ncbi:hypothetical protein COLO4_37055 [Corchorus olitorius]|uniref:Uncharacterized protein n=1 Tax=Corchorus olitorius TaxID=93759 RepID=A0A1R3G3N2_9ROSI|nr:hypothetical protein COLO4_37055 [Corchorus olitorius]
MNFASKTSNPEIPKANRDQGITPRILAAYDYWIREIQSRKMKDFFDGRGSRVPMETE